MNTSDHALSLIREYKDGVRGLYREMRQTVTINGTFTAESLEPFINNDLVFLVGAVLYSDGAFTDPELQFFSLAATEAGFDLGGLLASRARAEQVVRAQWGSFESAVTQAPDLLNAFLQVDVLAGSEYGRRYRDARLSLAELAAAWDGPVTSSERLALDRAAQTMDEVIAASVVVGEVGPPCWSPDPYRRFELRYWDGRNWTEHVSTGGVPAIDAIV